MIFYLTFTFQWIILTIITVLVFPIAHKRYILNEISIKNYYIFQFAAEGAFKKLKPEPNSGLSSVSGSVSSPGSGISSLPQHAGHTPTTVSCPTPARRRHRTTFTQVRYNHQIIKASIDLTAKQNLTMKN